MRAAMCPLQLRAVLRRCAGASASRDACSAVRSRARAQAPQCAPRRRAASPHRAPRRARSPPPRTARRARRRLTSKSSPAWRAWTSPTRRPRRGRPRSTPSWIGAPASALRGAKASSAAATLTCCCVCLAARACRRRFGQLRGVELGGVEPSLRAPTADGGAEGSAAAVAHARPDAPADFGAREDMLASAPKLQAPFIYIPRIATTDDAA